MAVSVIFKSFRFAYLFYAEACCSQRNYNLLQKRRKTCWKITTNALSLKKIFVTGNWDVSWLNKSFANFHSLSRIYSKLNTSIILKQFVLLQRNIHTYLQ